MADSDQQEQPNAVQPPTEGGEGIGEVKEEGDAAEERQDHLEDGAGQQGRGRVQ